MEEYKRDYDVFEQLGKGAYGTVYRVTDKSSGTSYACKVMSKERLGAHGIAQVKGEAAILGSLDHPSVVRLHRVMEDDEVLLLVMQLVTGGEVLKRLAQLHHYSERTACHLMRNFVGALKYVHTQGVVHRDLKPENLLLRSAPSNNADPAVSDSQIILADFGFAAKYEGVPMTKACGTPYYIAPELLQTGVYQTRKGYIPPPCDMWSAGIVCYVLLCGYPPFRVPRDTKDAKSKLFRQIVAGKVMFDRGTSWDRISDHAKDFIRRLLVVDPTQRMSAEQAEEHSWFEAHGATCDDHLDASLSELKMEEARTKAKGAVYGVEAAFKLLYSETCDKNSVKPNSSIVDQLDAATEPLHTLDLSNTYLGPRGFNVLVDIVNKHPTLRKLNLCNCLLNTDGVAKLCKVLRDPKAVSAVDTLDLSDNPLTSASGRALLYLLQTKRSITCVKLKRTHISQPLLNKIADQADRNKHISPKTHTQQGGVRLPHIAKAT